MSSPPPTDLELQRLHRRLGSGCLSLVVCILLWFGYGEFLVGHEESITDTAKFRLSEVADALQGFHDNCGRYPTQKESLQALLVRPRGLTRWNGPYLKRDDLKHVWGTPYEYMWLRGPKGRILVVSLGADRRPGGDGDGADLVTELRR